jgi:hypothetical protein
MPVGITVGATSLIGAGIQANAADRAAKAQADAAAQARQDQMPFMVPGQGAMASLAQLYGINPETGAADPNQAFNKASLDAFERSPDYQFALRSGTNAVNNSQAARGMLRSGNTLQALTKFGQDLGTQTFGNYRGALAQLAQIGAGAAGNAGNASMAQGAATASGIVGQANAFTGALGNIANYGLMQNQQQQQQQFLQNLLRPTAYAGSQPVLSGLPQAPYGSVFGPSALPGGVGAYPY